MLGIQRIGLWDEGLGLRGGQYETRLTDCGRCIDDSDSVRSQILIDSFFRSEDLHHISPIHFTRLIGDSGKIRKKGVGMGMGYLPEGKTTGKRLQDKQNIIQQLGNSNLYS